MKEVILKLWANEKYRQVMLVAVGLVVGALVTVLVYPTKQIREEAQKELRAQLEEEFRDTQERQVAELTEKFTQESNTLASQLEKSLQEQKELSSKVSKLSSENTKLKQKRRVETIVVKYPDGKEETHIVDVTDTESISSKHERQLSEISEKHTKQVAELEKKHQEDKRVQQEKSQVVVAELNTKLAKSTKRIEELEKSSKTVTTNSRPFGLGVGYTTDMNYSAEASYQFWGPAYFQLSGDSNFEDDYLGRLTLGVRF